MSAREETLTLRVHPKSYGQIPLASNSIDIQAKRWAVTRDFFRHNFHILFYWPSILEHYIGDRWYRYLHSFSLRSLKFLESLQFGILFRILRKSSGVFRSRKSLLKSRKSSFSTLKYVSKTLRMFCTNFSSQFFLRYNCSTRARCILLSLVKILPETEYLLNI